MLEILKEENGTIKAVCEWWLVNPDGSFNPNGKYVWIAEVEIAPQYRNNGILRRFIKIVTDKVPQATHGYFWRQYKYKGKLPKIYSRRQWLTLIGGEK